MPSDDIVIRLIQPHDYDQVAEFIVDYFCADEPLCNLEPKIIPSEKNRAEIMEYLKVGTSILAVKLLENGEEELVGVNVAIPKGPESIEEYFIGAELEGNTKYGQIMKLVGVASRQTDVFKRYGVDQILYSYLSCVKTTYRGHHYGTRLKEELMALAKKLNYKLVTVDCSSYYSASLCKRMGWDVVNFIPYSEYKDENGEQIFNPPAPHVGLTSLAVRV